MKIKYKETELSVTNTGNRAMVYRIGKRNIYKDETSGQSYVKVASIWRKFPEEVDY